MRESANPVVKGQVYARVLNVIDGQQRLTTLLMLFSAAHDLISYELERLLKKSPFATANPKAVEWVKQRTKQILGRLRSVLYEKQTAGEHEVYSCFPRMIRAFDDQWSYDEGKAIYRSPIAWLIFHYINHLSVNNGKRFKPPKPSASDGDFQEQYNRIRKFMTTVTKYLDNLESKEDFLSVADLANNKLVQETLFQDVFPPEVKDNLLSNEPDEELLACQKNCSQ